MSEYQKINIILPSYYGNQLYSNTVTSSFRNTSIQSTEDGLEKVLCQLDITDLVFKSFDTIPLTQLQSTIDLQSFILSYRPKHFDEVTN